MAARPMHVERLANTLTWKEALLRETEAQIFRLILNSFDLAIAVIISRLGILPTCSCGPNLALQTGPKDIRQEQIFLLRNVCVHT